MSSACRHESDPRRSLFGSLVSPLSDNEPQGEPMSMGMIEIDWSKAKADDDRDLPGAVWRSFERPRGGHGVVSYLPEKDEDPYSTEAQCRRCGVFFTRDASLAPFIGPVVCVDCHDAWLPGRAEAIA